MDVGYEECNTNLKQDTLKGRETLIKLGVDGELHNLYSLTHIIRM
jgi:hypothetical protein